MVYPIIWAGLFLISAFGMFKAGEKYKVKLMRDELISMFQKTRVRKETVEKYLSGIDERIKDSEITIEDFIKVLDEISKDLKTSLGITLASGWSSICDMKKKTKSSLAQALYDVADTLKQDKSEKKPQTELKKPKKDSKKENKKGNK